MDLERQDKDRLVGLIRKAIAPLLSDALAAKASTEVAALLGNKLDKLADALEQDRVHDAVQVERLTNEITTLSKNKSIVEVPELSKLSDKLDNLIDGLSKVKNETPSEVQTVKVANLKELANLGGNQAVFSAKFPFKSSGGVNSPAQLLSAISTPTVDALPVVNPDGTTIASSISVSATVDKTGLATDTGQEAQRQYLGAIERTLTSGTLAVAGSFNLTPPIQQNVTISGTYGERLVRVVNPITVASGVSITGTVDTELANAVTAADGMAGPTTAPVMAFPVIYDRVNGDWDRLTAANHGTNSNGTGILSAGMVAEFDDVSPTVPTENQFAHMRMSSRREIYTQIRDAGGNERGATVTAAGELNVNVGSQVNVTVSGIAGEVLSRVVNPVTVASGVVTQGDFLEVPFTTTIVAAVGTTDAARYKSVSVHIVTQGGSSTVTFQTSNDNVNWVSQSMLLSSQVGGTAGTVSTTSANVVYTGPLKGRYFRLNVTGIASGTTAGVIEFFTQAWTELTNQLSVSGTTTLTPGTSATNLGKAEDAVHTSGDVGVMALGVRNDAQTVLTSNDGDYSPIATDASGNIRVVMPQHNVTISGVSGTVTTSGIAQQPVYIANPKNLKTVVGSVSALGMNTVVSGNGSNRIKVYAFVVSTASATAVTPGFKGATSAAALWDIPLQALSSTRFGANLSVNPPYYIFKTPASEGLAINLTSAQQVDYSIGYFDDEV